MGSPGHAAGSVDQQDIALHEAEIIRFVKLTNRDAEQRKKLPTAHMNHAIAPVASIKEHDDVAPAEFDEQLRQRAVHFQRRNHAWTEVESAGAGWSNDRKSAMSAFAI